MAHRLRRSSFSGGFTLLLMLAALVGCSEDESTTTGPSGDLPPISDSDGELTIVRNEPGDFPAGAFRFEEAVPAPPSDTWILRDRSTGSLLTADGWAFEGDLAEAGVRLPQLAKMSAFWFAWSIFLPGSEIWGVEDDVREAAIESEENCLVPCQQIRRVLPRDAIPSLPNTGPPEGAPRFTVRGAADASYLRAGDKVIGLFDGTEARAYPHNLLWWHEVVNDTFGGVSYSVTFCPLTGSALVFSAEESSHGVSGNLYNSNLVMYDHATNSLFSQLRREAVAGPRKGERLAEVPFVETTWARWVEMYPDTKVLSSNTGLRDTSRYTVYPYGDYRTNHDDTFSITDPLPDPRFPNKWAVTGVEVGGTVRAYVHEIVAQQKGDRAVFRDEIGGIPVWIVFDRTASYLQVHHAGDPEYELDLHWIQAP